MSLIATLPVLTDHRNRRESAEPSAPIEADLTAGKLVSLTDLGVTPQTGRTRRALLRIQMDLLERDDLGGCSGAALARRQIPSWGGASSEESWPNREES